MTTKEIRVLRAQAVIDGDDLMIQLCDTALDGAGLLTEADWDRFESIVDAVPFPYSLHVLRQAKQAIGRPTMTEVNRWLEEQIEALARQGRQDDVDACRVVLAALDNL